MSNSIPLMIKVADKATPTIVSKDSSYDALFEVGDNLVGSDADAYKMSLRSFSLKWDRSHPESGFPERTLVTKENSRATIELIGLRRGVDVLEADRRIERTSLSGPFE